MQTKVKVIRKKRVFSEEYKRELVRLFELGKFSVLQLGKLYGVRIAVIYRWIYKYSAYNKRKIKVVEMATSSKQKLKELQKKISDLERVVGQKQLNIDFLEKMIEIAKDEYGIDIKKNFDTPPSTGSEKISKP